MTRDDLITRGMPLVRRMAHSMVRRCRAAVDVRDLICAGHEGLLRAADAYDENVGPFEFYAIGRVRGAMLDELRGLDWLTRHGRTRVNRVERAAHALRHKLGRAATDEEIATYIGRDEAAAIRAGGWTIAQFREASARPKQVNPAAFASDYPAPLDVLLIREEHTRLAAAVAALPARTQHVLSSYYADERSQLDIGRELGITESRVCQILTQAAARLRVILEPSSVPAPHRRMRNNRPAAAAHALAKLGEAAE